NVACFFLLSFERTWPAFVSAISATSPEFFSSLRSARRRGDGDGDEVIGRAAGSPSKGVSGVHHGATGARPRQRQPYCQVHPGGHQGALRDALRLRHRLRLPLRHQHRLHRHPDHLGSLRQQGLRRLCRFSGERDSSSSTTNPPPSAPMALIAALPSLSRKSVILGTYYLSANLNTKKLLKAIWEFPVGAMKPRRS
uniref:Uncharacterized protein n=1 Tax=Aegilops tauschii subsp. strangulata TaxID=200361 RepID=A0A453AF08_AEGTS